MKNLKLLLFLLLATVAAAQGADFKRSEDVIYGRKFGTALTLDVFAPTKTNGLGIVFVVSGGWYSAHEAISPRWFGPLLDRGYVVFAVVHGSQPKFAIPEIEQDMHRALRFIRANSERYGVHPDKLGITGASAGGHLSLMMAAKGKAGDPNAKDPIDREDSTVQCVACFFPPTDFLNYAKEGESAFSTGILQNFKPAFGPRIEKPEKHEELGREISPIYHLRSNMAPVLIVHGDADTLVPIYQARRFVEKCHAEGVEAKLLVREGKAHGWQGMEKDMEIFADWFGKHLQTEKKQ